MLTDKATEQQKADRVAKAEAEPAEPAEGEAVAEAEPTEPVAEQTEAKPKKAKRSRAKEPVTA